MSKRKVISLTIVILVVALAAVSAISYSIATKGNRESGEIAESGLTNRGAAISGMNYMSNIDLIIDNAVNGEDYNVLEIVPNGVNPSDLRQYISNEGFSKYVLTAHKEPTSPDMPAGRVNYSCLTVSAGTELTDSFGTGTVQTALDEADLIYISSPGYNSFDGGNNMSEALYNYLHVYALGNDKPIIMDYVTSNMTASNSKTYYDLITAISRNHIKFRTYSWAENLSAEDFFSAKGSYYLKYNVNDLPSAAPGTVLVVTASAAPGADSMYGRMQAAGDNAVISRAYYGRTSLIPNKLNYTIWNINNNALTVAELEKNYDYILLENDIKNSAVSDDVYKKIKALSESSKYVLYDARAVGSTGGNTVAANANNYLKLMDLLISNKGVARYTNVLSISNGFFTSLNEQGADGVAGSKAVADVINAADYRGSGMSGANGKKFRVLELQPCYPIDLDIAEENTTKMNRLNPMGIKGNYYEQPSEVQKGVTKDEVESGTEYYAFELSKAKIAYATGLNMNQIEIDQMSTEELISRKAVLLETYDLIYVGGNNSALTPYEYTVFLKNQNKEGWNLAKNVFTCFDMYTHTGVSVPLRVAASNNGHVVTNSIPFGNYDDQSQSTSVELNGNDITKIKLDEFLAYIDAGMPIIFEKKVTDAFLNVKNKSNRLEQLATHEIDPDSFMYDLLDSAYKTSEKKGSVLWGFDETRITTIDNSDKAYGNTLGDVTVYVTDTAGTELAGVVNASQTRPSLTLTNRPKEYIEGNANSFNEPGEKLSVTATATLPGVATADITMKLYVDYDGDGVFSEDADELVDSGIFKYNADAEKQNGVTLTYSAMDEDFYGIVSWKVVATAQSGACAVTTGYAYYPKKEDVEKKTIRILEIMPVNDTNTTGESEDENDGHSLYLCTECQMAEYRAKYNIWCNGTAQLAKNTSGDDESKGGINLGLHQHKFGIVKFDSTTMDENWESNLAASLMDDYEFELDIVTINEFEEIVKNVTGQSEEQIAANEETALDHYGKYLDYMDELENSEERENLRNELEKFVTSGYMNADKIEQYIEDEEYYKFWLYNLAAIGNISSHADLTNLAKYYNAYNAKRDKAIEEYNEYVNYTRLSGDEDSWMRDNFDMVVLGFAEDFGGKDLSLEACAQLASYIKKGGAMLNTHDSTTRYKGAGATNLTNELRAQFGMDRFHVTTRIASAKSDAVVSVKDTGSLDIEPTVTTAVKQSIPATIRLTTENFSTSIAARGNRDLEITVDYEGNQYYATLNINTLKVTEVGEEKPISEPINVSFKINNKVTGINVDLSGKSFTIQTGGNWSSEYGGQIPVSTFAGTVDAEGAGSVVVEQASKAINYSVKFPSPMSNKDVTYNVTLDGAGNASMELVSTGAAKASSEDMTATLVLKDKDGNFVPKGMAVSISYGTTKQDGVIGDNGEVSFNVKQQIGEIEAKGTVTLTNYDVIADMQLTGTSTMTTNVKRDGKAKDSSKPLKLTVNLTGQDGSPLADGTAVTLNANGTAYNGVIADGTVVFDSLPQVSISGNTKYYKYETEDSSLYFWTERALNGDSTSLDGIQWMGYWYRSVVGVTDPMAMYSTVENETSPYTYAEYEFQNAVFWNQGYTVTKGKGTDGASQVNEGIVTKYPFAISSELRISGTHAQTLALDMEDSDVAVWYTLSAGSSASSKAGASVFAASPYDGMDSYYLYSKGNIFYCGAGHTVVTGPDRDNNDERRLFINVIVNSVRNKGAKPKITVHEPNTNGAVIDKTKEEGNIFLDAKNQYYYNIDDSNGVPEFDFKVKVDTNTTLRQVYVYYDLNYGVAGGNLLNDYTDDEDHIMIAEYNTMSTDKAIAAGTMVGGELKEVRYDPEKKEGLKNLQLKDKYFEPYGGKYTYIVIKAIDGEKNVAYQRIKINLIPYLFDLTDATITNRQQYFTTYKFMMDIMDKTKFNI